MKHVIAIALLLAACSKDKSSGSQKGGSPDWGDDPRPLGSCVGISKPGVETPTGKPVEVCLESQTEDECTRPSDKMDYSYGHHTTCASRGYPKKCDGGGYPASARFKECPGNAKDPTAAATPSPNLDAAKEVIAIFDQALAAADDTKSDCKAFGEKLDGIRPRLWDLGKAHPGVLKTLSDAELKSIKAADTVEKITNALGSCAKDKHAIEFAFAVTKVIGA